MNKMIQVRNLKPELHKKVKIRATEEGVTITDWVTKIIENELARPTMKEVYARLKTRTRVHLSPSAVEMVRDDRDNR